MTVANLSPPEIDQAIVSVTHTAPHWVPILRGMRDFGIGFAVFEPATKAFWPAPGCDERSMLVVLVDDEPADRGPTAFHQPSLSRLLLCAGTVIINSARPHSALYQSGVDQLVQDREHIVVVETQPERLDLWTSACLDAGKPEHSILRVRVRGHDSAYHGVDAGDLPAEPGATGQA